MFMAIKKLRKLLVLGFFVIFAGIGVFKPSAYATSTLVYDWGSSTTLADIITNQYTLQVGDKLFSNFTFTATAGGGATAISSANINVVGQITTIAGVQEFGLEFIVGGGGSVTLGQFKDIVLNFNVTTTFGDNRIVDDFLGMTGSATHGGSVFIVEDVLNELSQTIANAQLTVKDNPTINILTDTGTFAPQDILKIQKDINLDCTNTTDASCNVQLSHFNQLFSQEKIPEPASMLLFGAGLVGLAAWGRKRLGKK